MERRDRRAWNDTHPDKIPDPCDGHDPCADHQAMRLPPVALHVKAFLDIVAGPGAPLQPPAPAVVPGGIYRLRSKGSAKCADIWEASPDNGAALRLYPCHTGDNQKFVLRNGQLISVLSGRCLDVWEGCPDNGAYVRQRDCRGADNQRWLLEPP